MENEMNRMLSRYTYPTSSEFPAFNIWGTPDQVVVTTEIPGIDPKSIEISVAGSTLTVRGLRDRNRWKKAHLITAANVGMESSAKQLNCRLP